MSAEVRGVSLTLSFGEETSLHSIIAALVSTNADEQAPYLIAAIQHGVKAKFDPLGQCGQINIRFSAFAHAEKFLAALHAEDLRS